MQMHNIQLFDPMLSIRAGEEVRQQAEKFPNCIIRQDREL